MTAKTLDTKTDVPVSSPNRLTTAAPLVGSVSCGTDELTADELTYEQRQAAGIKRAERIIALLSELLAAFDTDDGIADHASDYLYSLLNVHNELPPLAVAARSAEAGAIFGHSLFGASAVPIRYESRRSEHFSCDTENIGEVCYTLFQSLRPFVVGPTDWHCLMLAFGIAAHRLQKKQRKAKRAPKTSRA
jgi:hypothetical protein